MKHAYKKSEWCPPLSADCIGREVCIRWPTEFLPAPGRIPEKKVKIVKVKNTSRCTVETDKGYRLEVSRYDMRPADKSEWPKPEDNKRYWRRR